MFLFKFFALQFIMVLFWIIGLGMPTFAIENMEEEALFMIQGWFSYNTIIVRISTPDYE